MLFIIGHGIHSSIWRMRHLQRMNTASTWLWNVWRVSSVPPSAVQSIEVVVICNHSLGRKLHTWILQCEPDRIWLWFINRSSQLRLECAAASACFLKSFNRKKFFRIEVKGMSWLALLEISWSGVVEMFLAWMFRSYWKLWVWLNNSPKWHFLSLSRLCTFRHIPSLSFSLKPGLWQSVWLWSRRARVESSVICAVSEKASTSNSAPSAGVGSEPLSKLKSFSLPLNSSPLLLSDDSFLSFFLYSVGAFELHPDI